VGEMMEKIKKFGERMGKIKRKVEDVNEKKDIFK
jgi:hypothetical protein